MVFSAQQTGVNFRSLAHVLLCLISTIIGHGKNNAGGVVSGRLEGLATSLYARCRQYCFLDFVDRDHRGEARILR